MTVESPVVVAADSRVKCAICGALVHAIQHHLAREHADLAMTLEQYQEQYPGQPTMSAMALRKIEDFMKAKSDAAKSSVTNDSASASTKELFHEVFSLGGGAAAMSSSGKPINISVMGADAEHASMIPDIDPNYLFNVEVLKSLMMGLEMKIPVYLWGHAGTGKCLGKGTPVMMFNGSIKPVESVKAGELVMGPDSFPRLVVNTTTGRENLYRVTPTKGDAYVVNESHILSLRMSGGSENNCGLESGSIVNISVRDYLKKNASFKQAAKGWRTGVDFLPQVEPLAMEPYFLGLWLGDGNSANPVVWTADQEVKDYLGEYAARLGFSTRQDSFNEVSGLAGVSITRAGGIKCSHPLRKALGRYDLIGDKHVPHAFKTASRKDRLALLAGILDTDGSLDNGGYALTLKSERLLDDVIFVARSLGFAACKKEIQKTCTNAVAGPKVGTYFKCHIAGDVDEIPCKIARKIASPRLQKKNVLNVGITVELLGEGDYYGFELAGPDRLFLLGDFTVTHNTSIFEQIAARTRRPFFRVQHTANMEEEHIVGGWRLREGKTFFELGPLAMAMKFGWLYMADEYDFGRPEVTSVYQAVLEGKPLVIKEADLANRVIRPHPDFRICATGNTNGQGDESGLYQGTNVQNSANYERFGVVEQMPYMEKKSEARLVSQQAGIPLKDADKLVDFATRVRAEFDGGRLGNPISPRSLIYAAKIGMARINYRIGLEKAFINRLSSTDREIASQVAQRVFA